MLVAFVALAMAVGVVGTIVPVVPGLALVWVAAVVYAVADGIDAIAIVALALITTIGLAGVAAGVVLPHRAAGAGGASQGAVLLGAGTAVVGFFVVPYVGLPLGFVVGIFAGEWARTRAVAPAWRATVATLKGFGLATLAQVAAAMAMVAVWIAWVLVG